MQSKFENGIRVETIGEQCRRLFRTKDNIQ